MADGSPESPPVFAPPRPDDAARLVGPVAGWPYAERRQGGDRRSQPTPMLSRFLRIGQRARGRRRGEDRNIYVDRCARADMALVVSVFVLNLLDAWLTIVYLGYGGAEANPVARWLLERGTGWFLASKGLAVGACLLFLVLHRTFVGVRIALRTLVVFYGALLLYHIYLQAAALTQGIA